MKYITIGGHNKMKKFKFRSVIEYAYLADNYMDAYYQHYHSGEPVSETLISSLPVSTEGEALGVTENTKRLSRGGQVSLLNEPKTCPYCGSEKVKPIGHPTQEEYIWECGTCKKLSDYAVDYGAFAYGRIYLKKRGRARK